MPYAVQLAHAAPRPILVVNRRGRSETLSELVPDGCGEVWAYIRTHDVPHTGLNLAVYFDSEINFQCGVILQEACATESPVICTATPTGRVATAAHFGPYSRLADAHEAIRRWCEAQSLTIAGPCWEIYDHWNDDLSKLRTDVYYLLRDETA